MYCLSQNINNAPNRLIIFQEKALIIKNFKSQLSQTNPLSSTKNILKFGDKITFKNIFL